MDDQSCCSNTKIVENDCSGLQKNFFSVFLQHALTWLRKNPGGFRDTSIALIFPLMIVSLHNIYFVEDAHSMARKVEVQFEP